ncbi:MAG: nuclear transport factor 2 family protein [Thermoplasmata archaeon]
MSDVLLTTLKKAWETQDVEAAAALYAPEAIFEDGAGKGGQIFQGPEGVRTVMREMFRLPRAQFGVISMSSSPGRGVAEWTYSWADPRSGRRQRLRGVSIIEIRETTVVRETSYYNPEPEYE